MILQILQCLTVQGGNSSGGGDSNSNISRSSVKERFKTFNTQFEELHQRQSQWTVPDSELRESLRLAVAEVLLPAYRSFLKRFGYVSVRISLLFSNSPIYISCILLTLMTKYLIFQAHDWEWQKSSKVHQILSRKSWTNARWIFRKQGVEWTEAVKIVSYIIVFYKLRYSLRSCVDVLSIYCIQISFSPS